MVEEGLWVSLGSVGDLGIDFSVPGVDVGT